MNAFQLFPVRDNVSLLPTSPATMALAAVITAVVAATSLGWLQWESLAFRNDLAGTEWWRSFTYIFIHAGWVHAALNLLLLYLYGPQLERLIGSTTFLALALGGGACGVVLLLAIWPTEGSSRGASETAFAVVGALVAFYVARTGWSASTTRALTAILVLLLISGLLTIGGVGTLAEPGWQGVLYGIYIHAVGVAVGLALGMVAARTADPFRPIAVALAGALLLGGLTVLGADRWDERYRSEASPEAPAEGSA